jgi:hypothetical protein
VWYALNPIGNASVSAGHVGSKAAAGLGDNAGARADVGPGDGSGLYGLSATNGEADALARDAVPEPVPPSSNAAIAATPATSATNPSTAAPLTPRPPRSRSLRIG